MLPGIEDRSAAASRSVLILVDGLLPAAVKLNALHSATTSRSVVAKSKKWGLIPPPLIGTSMSISRFNTCFSAHRDREDLKGFSPFFVRGHRRLGGTIGILERSRFLCSAHRANWQPWIAPGSVTGPANRLVTARQTPARKDGGRDYGASGASLESVDESRADAEIVLNVGG
jgi:hypothetical protein